MDLGEGQFLICKYNGVAVVELYWRKDDIEERTAEIVALHVSKQVWGKGVGKEILEYAVQEIEREGYEKIELWIFEKNLRARRFYSKNGFCETQEKRETVFDGEIEIKYLK